MTLIGDASKRRSRPWGRWLLVGAIVLIIASLSIGRAFFGEVVRYRGDQMHPAIRDGDWLLIDHRAPPRVGDLVLVLTSPRPVVRRVVASAGHPQPTSTKRRRGVPKPKSPPVVPEGQLYVQCERPSLCPDASAVGLVAIERIKGVVITRWVGPF